MDTNRRVSKNFGEAKKGLNDLKLDRNRGCEIVGIREDGAKTKPRKAKSKGCDYLA